MAGDAVAARIESAREAERAGDWDVAMARYEEALGSADEGEAPDILRWIGTLHRERGEFEAAMDRYQASLASADALGLRLPVAAGLNCMGIVEQFRGRMGEAEQMYAEAGAIAEELGESRLGAMVAQNLATLAGVRGDVELALRHYDHARRRFTELGDDLATAWVLNNMGMGYVDLRAWDAAEKCLNHALTLAGTLNDAPTLASIRINSAELSLRRRDFDAARDHCDQAFELLTRLKSVSGVAEADKLYGMLYRDTARPGLAETHFARAVEAAHRISDPLLEAEALQEWALLHWELADSQEAFRCLSTAHRIFTELGASRELLDLDRRLGQIEEIYLRVVRAWGESIEAKDEYTAGHCQRVADYACALAETAGISGRDLTWFRMGAFLHDLGKVEVPAEVLNKPGKLTPEEWSMMQSHTTEGDRIVSTLGFPWNIQPMVRSHHERWDGGGYPDGLRGEEIPLPARILCVADVYDALTTARSYRGALPRSEALAIMESESGKLLDPHLFERFRAVLGDTSDSQPPLSVVT